jgi:outer membrane receptor protein involved in Fe transport
MSRLYVAAVAGVAHLALVAPTSVQAQSSTQGSAQSSKSAASPEQTSDIVVTATRQGSQALIAVPLAIQAFGGEQLQERGIKETSDLMSAIPGASSGEQVGSVLKTFTLRGVGAAGGVGDSPIGYYVDNVPFAIPNFPLAPRCALLTSSGSRS